MPRLPTHLDVTLWNDTITFMWIPPAVAAVKFRWWSYPTDLARAVRASNENIQTCGDREYLERIFAVIIELPVALEELASVTSFRFINPPTGFIYDDQCTGRIEGDRDWLIRHAARMASGQKMEHGQIEYNRSLTFPYSAEAKMTGDISIALPQNLHGQYKDRVRPLVERSLTGATFEYLVSDVAGDF